MSFKLKLLDNVLPCKFDSQFIYPVVSKMVCGRGHFSLFHHLSEVLEVQSNSDSKYPQGIGKQVI